VAASRFPNAPCRYEEGKRASPGSLFPVFLCSLGSLSFLPNLNRSLLTYLYAGGGSYMTAGTLFRRARSFAPLLALPLFAAFVLACSDDDEPEPTPTQGPAQVTMTLADFNYTPASLTVGPGQTVNVNVTNGGQAPHTFTIDGVVDTTRMAAGEAKSVTFTAPASGTLTYYCTIHTAARMSGQFTVSPTGSTQPQGGPGSPAAGTGDTTY
jgi:plastocyanin